MSKDLAQVNRIERYMCAGMRYVMAGAHKVSALPPTFDKLSWLCQIGARVDMHNCTSGQPRGRRDQSSRRLNGSWSTLSKTRHVHGESRRKVYERSVFASTKEAAMQAAMRVCNCVCVCVCACVCPATRPPKPRKR